MARIKDLAKDTLIYGFAVVLNPILNTFVLLRLITGQLDSEQYGIYTYLYALSGILVVLYAMRMETTYFRMTNDHSESSVFSSAMSTVVSMSTVFSIILVLVAPSIADFFNNPDFSRYLIYFAMILWLDAFCAIPFARLRNNNQSLKFSILKICNVLLTLVLILFSFLILPKINTSFLGTYQDYIDSKYILDALFISNLIASFFLFIYFLPSIFNFKVGQIDKSLIKKMLIYTLPLILIGVAGNANQLLDRILIPFITGSSLAEGLSNNGIYGGATKIATVMLLFTKAFNYAFDPYVFKTYKENKNTDHLGRIAGFYTAFSGMIFVGAVAFFPILAKLLDKEFRSGMQYVPLLLLAYLVMGLYYHFSVWYKLNDKTMIGAWIALIGVAITLTVNHILIAKMGLFGPALTIFINYSIISVLCILWGRKHLPIDYPFNQIIAHILFSTLLVYFMVNYITDMDAGWIINPILFALYLASLFLFDKRIQKTLTLFTKGFSK